MKNLILIVFIVFFYLECLCQEKTIAWLPELYVSAILSKDTLANIYLSPFEGFELHNGVLYVLTFRGELNPVKAKKIIIDGKEKNQLLDLHYLVNLKYNSKGLAEKLSKAIVYISKVNDKLLLEIINEENVEKILFIDRSFNYEFISINKAKQQLIDLVDD